MTAEQKNKLTAIAEEIVRYGKKYIALHYIGANSDTMGKIVKWYHTKVKGWGRAGYHLFMNWDGTVEEIEPTNSVVNGMSAGWGRNREWTETAFQLCFGTVNKELKLHPSQAEAILYLGKEVIKRNPKVLIGGHREFPDLSWMGNRGRQNTGCPGFSVSDWLEANGVKRENCFYFVYKG